MKKVYVIQLVIFYKPKRARKDRRKVLTLWGHTINEACSLLLAEIEKYKIEMKSVVLEENYETFEAVKYDCGSVSIPMFPTKLRDNCMLFRTEKLIQQQAHTLDNV